jgi:RimJ/RimL family protein N-acetyltransferase
MSPADQIAIAAIAPEHIGSYRRALDVVARERKYLTMLEAFPPTETRDFVMSLIARGDPQFVALAEAGVVGWCDIQRIPFPSHAHRGTLGVGVLPAYRGKGLGRRLLETTLSAAARAGFVRVELSVRADNARAIALYEKLDFVREGVARDAVFVDGVYHDAILMALVDRSRAR